MSARGRAYQNNKEQIWRRSLSLAKVAKPRHSEQILVCTWHTRIERIIATYNSRGGNGNAERANYSGSNLRAVFKNVWIYVYENFHLWLQFVQLFGRLLELHNRQREE